MVTEFYLTIFLDEWKRRIKNLSSDKYGPIITGLQEIIDSQPIDEFRKKELKIDLIESSIDGLKKFERLVFLKANGDYEDHQDGGINSVYIDKIERRLPNNEPLIMIHNHTTTKMIRGCADIVSINYEDINAACTLQLCRKNIIENRVVTGDYIYSISPKNGHWPERFFWEDYYKKVITVMWREYYESDNFNKITKDLKIKKTRKLRIAEEVEMLFAADVFGLRYQKIYRHK